MIPKVGHIFVIQGGIVKGDAQGVDIVCCPIFMTTDLDANVADTSLESSQEHILENLTFHQTYLVHLIYLFALGVPAYRIRWYVSVSLATIERTFQSIKTVNLR